MATSKIKLVRIDDRLIHGQVMTAWLHYARVNDILIIDDQTAHDPFIKSIIEIVVPKQVTVNVLSVIESIDFLKDYDGNPLIILVKNPFILQILIQEGIDIKQIFVGGMASQPGRKRIYKAVSASQDEIAVFKDFVNAGIKVVVQIIPDEKPIDIKDLIL